MLGNKSLSSEKLRRPWPTQPVSPGHTAIPPETCLSELQPVLSPFAGSTGKHGPNSYSKDLSLTGILPKLLHLGGCSKESFRSLKPTASPSRSYSANEIENEHANTSWLLCGCSKLLLWASGTSSAWQLLTLLSSQMQVSQAALGIGESSEAASVILRSGQCWPAPETSESSQSPISHIPIPLPFKHQRLTQISTHPFVFLP